MNPYLLLAAGAAYIAVAVGGFFYGEHVDGLAWKSSTAALQADAAAKLDAANQAAAAKDKAAAQAAIDLGAQYDAQAKAIADARDAAVSSLDDSVRRLTQCRRSGSGAVPSAAANPGAAASGTTGSAGGLSDGIAEHLAKLGAGANTLAATVKTCVAWANQVGNP